jgi:putative tryptophan/tyrosine transport system substrate-binding protein
MIAVGSRSVRRGGCEFRAYAASLAKPGGNITGFMNLESSMGSKLGELLKEVAPTITRVAVMFNPDTAPDRGTYFLRPVEAAAPSLHVEVMDQPQDREGARVRGAGSAARSRRRGDRIN